MTREKLFEILIDNYGKIIGSIFGLIVAILFLTLGFFKTILLISLIGLGYYIGKKIDNRESIIEILDRILPNGYLK